MNTHRENPSHSLICINAINVGIETCTEFFFFLAASGLSWGVRSQLQWVGLVALRHVGF